MTAGKNAKLASKAPQADGPRSDSAPTRAAAAPSPLRALGSVFRFQLARFLAGRKLRLAFLAAALVLFIAAISRYALSADGVEALQGAYGWGFFRLLVLLVPFLMTSDLIGEEVEARTFTYLTLRPISRGALLLGKYLAATCLSAAIVIGALLLTHLSCLIADGQALISELMPTVTVAGLSLLLCLAYCAICIFWGALAPEASTMISAIHLVLFELGLSFAPSFLRWGSMSYLAQQIADLPKAGMLAESAPDVSTFVGLIVIVLLSGFLLLFAVLTLRASEYRLGKD